jgi:hypothetical protein
MDDARPILPFLIRDFSNGMQSIRHREMPSTFNTISSGIKTQLAVVCNHPHEIDAANIFAPSALDFGQF